MKRRPTDRESPKAESARKKRVAAIKSMARRASLSRAPKRTSEPDNGDGLPQPAAANPAASLKPDEIEGFRRLLLDARRQLAGDVDHMQNEALRRSRSDASGDLSLMPIHMADIGTDNYEQEFTIGLIENETETVREIDAALERIQNGTYGICEATRRPIGKTRLRVMPWARYCVTHERSEESKKNRRR